MKYFLLALLINIAFDINAQVTKANLRLDYNEETSNFDVFLVIDEGTATSSRDRIHASAQVSFNVPNDAKVEIESLYNPIRGNISGSDTQPQIWLINSKVESPPAAPTRNFFSVETPWSPVSRYNNLKPEDEVKLFSLSVETEDICSVRFFNKNTDPGPLDDGFFGADFTNSIILGASGVSLLDSILISKTSPEGCTSTNTEDISLEKITLWPNPSSNMIHINNVPTDSHILVYDINGQLLKTITEVGESVEINISTWESGTYFLKVENVSSRYIKFQKQ